MRSLPLFRFGTLAMMFICCLLIQRENLSAQPAASRNDNTRSSRGKDFYLCFPPNFHAQTNRDSANTRDSLYIYITCDKAASGTITYRNRFGRSFSPTFAITDPRQFFIFGVSYDDIELEGFNSGGARTANIQNETPAPQTFRIQSNEDVTVYALNQARFTSDAMLVLPVAALGREYVIMAYNSDGGGSLFTVRPNDDTPSQFAVVATEDNTEITVSPRVPTYPPTSALIIPTTATVPQQRAVLNRGEAYLVQADTRILGGISDLTGSRVRATKPVAVFAGHQRTVLPIMLRSELGSRDCLLEQLPSVETWGKSIFVVPHQQPSEQAFIGTDIYRVLAAYNGTIVRLNGVVVDTLNAGEFLERQLLSPAWITASDQILVAQFKKSANTRGSGVLGGGGTGAELIGDPFMMIIPTEEQYDKSYRFINVSNPDNVRGGAFFTEHFITIVSSTSGISSLRVDEQPVNPAAFRPIVNSGFSYANFRVSAGVHTARGDSSFGLYVYGYGAANSYGYIGGGKLRVIAPDRDAPELALTRRCFGISGTVLDTLITDSRLERVQVQPATQGNISIQGNVQIQVEQFRAFADSVRFQAQLINIFQDGSLRLEAKDSIGFVTTRFVPLYGFTVGLQGQGSMNPAPQLRFELPTGSTRTFSLVLNNYGATAQTVTALRFAQTNLQTNLQMNGQMGQGIRLNRTFPILLAAGASDTLRFSYTSRQDGVFTDTVSIVSTCATREVAVINFRTTSDRTAPNLGVSADACQQTFRMEALETGALSSGIAALGAQNLVNCTFRIDSFGVERSLAQLRVLNPRQDAIYTLTVRDSSGNTRLQTDTIQGFTLEAVGERARLGQFGETLIGSSNACLTLRYRNYGLKPFRFEGISPRGNRFFSTPQTQFPLEIPSGASRTVQVCFSPTERQNYRDSLILTGNCVGDTILLEGAGISPDRFALSRCDVPLRLRTLSTPNTLAVLNSAPNPASDKISLSISVSEAAVLGVSIFASNGTAIRHFTETRVPEGVSTLEFDTSDLEQGVYFCAVQAGAKRVMRQIVVVR
ncbi:MAG: T9SS C-terminal target domain-containing protein [Candidatus Kapaibacterium sp.]|nr:MAG: T9SS C-terminal target domain-containing protein [Candidatus Kapabacteria bacterium]